MLNFVFLAIFFITDCLYEIVFIILTILKNSLFGKTKQLKNYQKKNFFWNRFFLLTKNNTFFNLKHIFN